MRKHMSTASNDEHIHDSKNRKYYEEYESGSAWQYEWKPSKHNTSTQCWVDVGPTS